MSEKIILEWSRFDLGPFFKERMIEGPPGSMPIIQYSELPEPVWTDSIDVYGCTSGAIMQLVRLAKENKKLKIRAEGADNTLVDYLKIMKDQELYIRKLNHKIELLKSQALLLGGCCRSEGKK